MKTVVALFDNFADAQAAVQELVDDAFDRSRISLVAGDREGAYAAGLKQPVNKGDATATGAATGAVLGGIGGILVGLGALAIPGIGPVIAAGPLIAGLVGAGVGATVGGLVGVLVDAGLPEEHAGYYAEGVRRGGTLVSVESADSEVNRVIDILDHHDPVDINERVSTWRQSGWTGFDPNADLSTYQKPAASRYEEYTREPRSSATVNPASENLHSTGSSYPTPNTGSPATEDMISDRARINQAARGGSTGDWSTSTQKQGGGSYAAAGSGSTTWNPKDVASYDSAFHNHYQNHFANSGYTFEQFQPAYRYGYTLANDNRFRGRDWAEIEPDARIYWTSHYADSPWEQFKDAVRHGWQEVKQAVTG